MFLFPNLQQIWADGEFIEPTFLAAMCWANLLLCHAGWILAAAVLAPGLPGVVRLVRGYAIAAAHRLHWSLHRS